MSHVTAKAADGVISFYGDQLHSVYIIGAAAVLNEPPPQPVKSEAPKKAQGRRRPRGTVAEYGVGPDQFTVLVTALRSFANKGLLSIEDFWAEVRRLGFGRCTLSFFPKHGIIEYKNKMFRVLRDVTPKDYQQYTKEYQTYLDRRRWLRGPQAAARAKSGHTSL